MHRGGIILWGKASSLPRRGCQVIDRKQSTITKDVISQWQVPSPAMSALQAPCLIRPIEEAETPSGPMKRLEMWMRQKVKINTREHWDFLSDENVLFGNFWQIGRITCVILCKRYIMQCNIVITLETFGLSFSVLCETIFRMIDNVASYRLLVYRRYEATLLLSVRQILLFPTSISRSYRMIQFPFDPHPRTWAQTCGWRRFTSPFFCFSSRFFIWFYIV